MDLCLSLSHLDLLPFPGAHILSPSPRSSSLNPLDFPTSGLCVGAAEPQLQEHLTLYVFVDMFMDKPCLICNKKDSKAVTEEEQKSWVYSENKDIKILKC